MSDPARVKAAFPLPPPAFFRFAFGQMRGNGEVFLTQSGMEFLQMLWAGLQGSGGIIENYLDKHLPEGSIFVGQDDGIAAGVPMSGDASIAPDGEITVSRVRVQMTAGEDVSGHFGVTANSSGEAVYPDITALADGIGFVGITTGAIVSGQQGPVQIMGEMSEPSWTWTPGEPLYIDDGGVLTQSIPSGAFILQIGVARTATDITIGERYLIATP